MGLGLFYNDTVTLFNYFCDPDTEEEKCYLTLLENVNLVETKGANVTKSGMDSADAVKLFVDLGKIPKPYMEPKAWDALPDDEKPNYITFHPTDDFFINGTRYGAVQGNNRFIIKRGTERGRYFYPWSL